MQFKQGDYVVGWTQNGYRVVGELYWIAPSGAYRYYVGNKDVGLALCQRVEHHKTYALREYFGLNDPTPCN